MLNLCCFIGFNLFVCLNIYFIVLCLVCVLTMIDWFCAYVFGLLVLTVFGFVCLFVFFCFFVLWCVWVGFCVLCLVFVCCCVLFYYFVLLFYVLSHGFLLFWCVDVMLCFVILSLKLLCWLHGLIFCVIAFNVLLWFDLSMFYRVCLFYCVVFVVVLMSCLIPCFYVLWFVVIGFYWCDLLSSEYIYWYVQWIFDVVNLFEKDS